MRMRIMFVTFVSAMSDERCVGETRQRQSRQCCFFRWCVVRRHDGKRRVRDRQWVCRLLVEVCLVVSWFVYVSSLRFLWRFFFIGVELYY